MTRARDNADLGDSFGVLGSGVTGGSGLNALPIGSSAFFAGFDASGWITVASEGVVPFNNVSGDECFNVGSDFSTVNNRYDVPATGIYQFGFWIYTGNADTTNGFKFQINHESAGNVQAGQADIVTFTSDNSSSTVHTGTLIVQMSSGDDMRIVSDNTSDCGTGNSLFWGMRIT